MANDPTTGSGSGSGSGGKSQPNVVTITHVVAWNAPLPASWTSKQGNTIYRHVYVHGPKPAQSPQQEHVSQVQHGLAQESQAVTIRRQRFLRKHGYNVVVDGQWGARTQAAWRMYQQRQRFQTRLKRTEAAQFRALNAQHAAETTKLALQQANDAAERLRSHDPAKVARDFQLGRVEGLMPGPTWAERAREQDRIDKRLAAIEIDRRREALGLEQMRLGTLLGIEDATRKLHIKGPRNVAGKMSIRSVVEVLFDPQTGTLNTENPDIVKHLQRKLRADGYDVAVDGVYGQKTFKALVDAWEANAEKEHRQAVRQVEKRYYRGGLLTAGERVPEWWMLPGYDRVPKPGELLKILAGEGFSAAVLFKTLEAEAERRADWVFDPVYTKWRNDYLQQQSGNPSFLRLSPGERYLVPYSQPFLAARSFDQLQGQMDLYERQLEAEYLEEQRRQMDDKNWFLKAYDDFSGWFQQEVIDIGMGFRYATADVQRLLGMDTDYLPDHAGFLSYVKGRWGDDPEYDRYLQEGRASVYADWEAHPWKGIAARILIDPINLIPGAAFRIPFVAVGRSSLWLEKTGYALTASGRLWKVPLAATLPARTGRYASEEFARGWENTLGYLRDTAALHPLSPLGSAYRAAVYATRLKGTLETTIQLRMRQARWAGYRASGVTALKQRAAAEAGKFVDGWEVSLPKEVTDALAATEPEMLARITEIVPDEQIDAYVQAGVSLKAGVDNPELSAVGLHVQARYKETARVWAAEQVARSEARAIAKRAADPDGIGVVTDDVLYKAEYEKALEEVRERIGFYFEGSGDPALSAAIRARTWELNERIDNILLPMLQARIEAALGDSLWDEAGLWVGAQGDIQALLRQVLRKELNHAEDVRTNPLYGRYFSAGQHSDYAKLEIERRANSKVGYARVREAAGESPPGKFGDWDEWIDAEVHKIERDVEDAWEFVRGKGWTDTRVKIRVPALYAGHLQAEARADLAHRFFVEHKAELAELQRLGEVTASRGVIRSVAKSRAIQYRRKYNITVERPDLDEAAVTALAKSRLPSDMTKADAAIEIDRRAEELGITVGKNEDVPHPSTWSTGGDPMTDRQAFELGILMEKSGELENLPRLAPKPLPPGDTPFNPPMPPSDPFLRAVSWLDAARPSMKVKPYDELGIRTIGPTLESEVLRMDSFKDLAEARMMALRTAEAESRVQMVRQQGHFWEAIRYTENRPLRVLAKSFLGATAAWKFSVLALRPAWFARNNADNTLKVLLEGTIDPRFWFSGGKGTQAGTKIHSIFEQDLRSIREFVRWADKVFGAGDGAAVAYFDAALDRVWAMSDKLLQQVFWMHGIPVSERAITEAQMSNDLFRSGGSRVQHGILHSGAGGPAATPFRSGIDTTFSWAARSFRDNAWELMGTRPENYFKRVLYRSTYAKAIARGADEYEATKEAWAKVEKVLFDYSKITIAEEGLKPFLPFIQFWRKNTVYWTRSVVEKPWFLAGIYHFEEGLKKAHEDWPEWMQRYIHVRELSDATARVPGLAWLGPQLADLNVMYDPLNFFSFAPLYRAFKSENPTLPSERAGLPFISGFVDGMNEFGLGLNPLIRKPLEVAGVLNLRSWQTIFPQTQMIQAFTREFWTDRFPNGLDLEAMLTDPILKLMGQATSAEAAAANFNYYVQMEMTNQRVRGEEVSRERAEEKIRDFFLVQTVVGFFGGAYVRRMTPEDFYLYQIAERLHEGSLEFSELSQEDQENYRLWKLKKADPVAYDRYLEAIPLIRTFYTSDDRQAYLAENPEILPYVDRQWSLRLPSDRYIQQAALSADTQAAMGFYEFVHVAKLSPEMQSFAESVWVTDELRHFWNDNDTPKERRDKTIRGAYFRYLEGLNDAYHSIPENDFDAKSGFLSEHPELQRWWDENNTASDDYKAIVNSVNADLRQQYFEYVDAGDWASADSFLHRFPFIFEFTSAAGRVSADGEWIVDAQGNRIRRAFSQSQHAKDYLAAKPYLDFYFSLPKEKRSAWLNGDSQGALIVREYFKKYSTANAAGRKFQALTDAEWTTMNPELRKRLTFWQKYFSIPADQRPAFVQKNAEKYGIFVYGIFGDKERHEREQEWRRRAFLSGSTPRATAYLYIAPLLDFYFTLSKKEKPLFLRANPEVGEYLDKYAQGSATGDAALDKLLEEYFNLPYASNERSHFLGEHPEIQDFFDSRSTPEELAMHNLLEVYFGIANPRERKDFLAQHPEIGEYFDKRQRERANLSLQMGIFDLVDPRLAPFRDRAARDELAIDALRYQTALKRAARDSSQELSYRGR